MFCSNVGAGMVSPAPVASILWIEPTAHAAMRSCMHRLLRGRGGTAIAE